MKSLENDPDTLQTLDELDEKWVKSWRKAANKNPSKKPKLKMIVLQQEKTLSPILQK